MTQVSVDSSLSLVGKKGDLNKSSVAGQSRHCVLLQGPPLMGVLHHHHSFHQDEAAMEEVALP